MSLFSRAARFARSPQGKKAVEKAKAYANKPETKEKIEQVRERVSGKDKPAAGTGDQATASPAGSSTTQAEPTAPAAGGTPPVNEPAAAGEQPAQGNPAQTP